MAGAIAGVSAAAAYLDAKYHITKDIKGIRGMKAAQRDLTKTGNTPTALPQRPILTGSSTRQRPVTLVPIRSSSPTSTLTRRSHLVPHRLLHLGRNIRQCLPIWTIPAPPQRAAWPACRHVHDESARISLRTSGFVVDRIGAGMDQL